MQVSSFLSSDYSFSRIKKKCFMTIFVASTFKAVSQGPALLPAVQNLGEVQGFWSSLLWGEAAI